MRLTSLLALALSLALLSSSAYAQQVVAKPGTGGAPPRTMSAARRTSPIAIDGRLDDAAWAQAEPSGDFTQSYPKPAAPPSDRTEVRVLYDDAAIYVGIRMYDSAPDSIAAGRARPAIRRTRSTITRTTSRRWAVT
jgi:hypothetical protein